jgi:hypothetical protein
MHTLFRPLALLALVFTSACSTVVEGSSQKITVDSSPQGAQCFIQQAGDIVGRVTTPGTAEIGKSKNDLVIGCSKDGYESVTIKNKSDMALTSFGNMAFYQLSFLGNAVDSATGASNKYDSKVFVTLNPATEPMAFPAPPGMRPAIQLPVQTVAGYSMQPPSPAPQMTAAAASPAPQPAPPTPAPADTHTNPAIHAAIAMAKASAAMMEHQQVAQLSYAEQMIEAGHRPPFEINQ